MISFLDASTYEAERPAMAARAWMPEELVPTAGISDALIDALRLAGGVKSVEGLAFLVQQAEKHVFDETRLDVIEFVRECRESVNCWRAIEQREGVGSLLNREHPFGKRLSECRSSKSA